MSFFERIRESAERNKSRVVLALDTTDVSKVYKMIDILAEHVCSIKLNMHLILQLDIDGLKGINEYAHSKGLQSIADIKLNDIPNTNTYAIEHLYRAGFDALTLNPIIGYSALNNAISNIHTRGMGAIALVYMSHVSAQDTYGMSIRYEHKGYTIDRLYMLFLAWAVECNADGVVVGATRPNIVKECNNYIASRGANTAIFSPGVDAQGGDARLAIESGSEYIIVGRSVIDSDNPVNKVLRLKGLYRT